MGTKTRFEEEAKGNSAMAYFSQLDLKETVALLIGENFLF